MYFWSLRFLWHSVIFGERRSRFLYIILMILSKFSYSLHPLIYFWYLWYLRYLQFYSPYSYIFHSLWFINDEKKLILFQQKNFFQRTIWLILFIRSKLNIITKILRVKDFNSFNVKMFLRELDSLDWTFLYYANINSKMETFNKLLLNCYDKHAPIIRDNRI